MRIFKDMKTAMDTHVPRDFTCAYLVTCDDAQSRSDELCFSASNMGTLIQRLIAQIN
jgi:hypothetical protein